MYRTVADKGSTFCEEFVGSWYLAQGGGANGWACIFTFDAQGPRVRLDIGVLKSIGLHVLRVNQKGPGLASSQFKCVFL